MTVMPFLASLPKALQVGDEIILKGKIRQGARIFSINFTLDECPDPPNVAYHFETRFNNNTVAHNFKTNGNWNSEIVNENTWIEGTGQEFSLTFAFCEEKIFIYTDNDFQYEFEHQFDMGDIRFVQLWDDVDYVSEIAFRYKNN